MTGDRTYSTALGPPLRGEWHDDAVFGLGVAVDKGSPQPIRSVAR